MLTKILDISPQTAKFLSSAKPALVNFLWVVVPTQIIFTFFYQIQPIFYKLALDTVQNQNPNLSLNFWNISINNTFQSIWQSVIILLMIPFVMEFFDKIFNAINENLINRLSYKVKDIFQDQLFWHLNNFDHSYLQNTANQTFFLYISDQIDILDQKIRSIFSNLITIPVSILGILFILPLIHPYLIGFILIMAVINLIFENFKMFNWQKHQIGMSQQVRLFGSLRNIANMEIATIKGQGQSQKFYQKLSAERNKLWDYRITQQTENTNLNLWNRIIEQIFSYLGIMLSFWLFLGGIITLGTLIVFGQYTNRIKSIFDKVGEVFKTVIELRFDLIKLDFLLNLKTKIDTSGSYPIMNNNQGSTKISPEESTEECQDNKVTKTAKIQTEIEDNPESEIETRIETKIEPEAQAQTQSSLQKDFEIQDAKVMDAKIQTKNSDQNSDQTPHQRFLINKIVIQNANFTYPKFLAEEREFIERLKNKMGFMSTPNYADSGSESSTTNSGDRSNNQLNNQSNNDANTELKPKNQLSQTTHKLKQYVQNLIQNFIKAQSGRFGNIAIKKLIDSLEKSFDEQAQSKPIIQNLNLTFESGKIYALVGYNGAGKTTLVNLIKRNLELTEGSIDFVFAEESALSKIQTIKTQTTKKVGKSKKNKAIKQTKAEITQDLAKNQFSRNIKTLFPIDIASQTASMSQIPVIFRMTKLREFFSFGRADWSEKDEQKVMDLIQKLGLGTKVTSLDLAYGENLELSGGQRQMLDLIRVLVEDKPVLILDEGTNQMDAEKEELILNVIKEISQNKIVIFVTHKMTTASKCDQIVVLNNGIIEDMGTHKELILRDNLYKTFWDLQVI